MHSLSVSAGGSVLTVVLGRLLGVSLWQINSSRVCKLDPPQYRDAETIGSFWESGPLREATPSRATERSYRTCVSGELLVLPPNGLWIALENVLTLVLT